MEIKQGFIGVEGFELGYRIEGEGTPVLVIGSHIYYPRLFSEELRRKLKLIFIDHRGFASPPRELPADSYSLDTIVQDIELIREKLGLDRFVILGHSGHAFLAAEYAGRFPDRVSGVVLLNSAPSNSPDRQAGSIRYFEENADPDRKTKFEADISQLASDLEREPERRFAHLLVRMGAHSFYDFNFDSAYLWDGVYTNMAAIDHLWGVVFAEMNLLDSLPRLEKPVLLGLGCYDYLVAPVSLWDGIEDRCPNVRKVVFEKSGHNPMLDEGEEFERVIVSWIQSEELG